MNYLFHCRYLCLMLLVAFPVWAQSPVTGVDTTAFITSNSVMHATELLGQAPKFWGRYFEGPYQYNTAMESAPLHQANIRLLPVGDNTTNVDSGYASGQADGQRQAQAYIAALGEDHLVAQGGEFYIFLDVELGSGEPHLSPDYYRGWSHAVETYNAKVKLLPGVYMSASDTFSSKALTQAIAKGAKCYGLWIAGYLYFNKAAAKIPMKLPAWNQDHLATPKVLPSCYPSDSSTLSVDGSSCPVLFWQYNGNISNGSDLFDMDMMNPNLNTHAVLKRLALPPSSAPVTKPVHVSSSSSTCPSGMHLYTVQPGQTLAGIARQACGHGTPWTSITQQNGQPFTEASASRLAIGQPICLPSQCQ
ncbi:MAG: hypothetical protein ETSY2_21930 [Candidatus Entotheonella gemina]|uniref:LysM domain-containing protein n=2 Tax=Candidatus Entotheonella TaxID=93171 RepID=W4M5J6_9BACT|nr:MAG: hypothetical protein ETSY2_21930 [Candidatus Entotheonella gemina]